MFSIAPQFVVPDVVRTAEYYRDVLGFTIKGYWRNPPVYSIVARDGIAIHFGKGDTTEAQGNVLRRKGGLDAYIFVRGVDVLYDEFKQRKADLLTDDGPIDTEYHNREIVIRDCNGFVIAFGEGLIDDNPHRPYTLGNWTAKAGKEQAFVSEWEAFAQWTGRNNAGAGSGHLLQDSDHPEQFVSFGAWQSPEAIRVWRESAEFKAFVSKVRELCDDFKPRSLVEVARSSD